LESCLHDFGTVEKQKKGSNYKLQNKVVRSLLQVLEVLSPPPYEKHGYSNMCIGDALLVPCMIHVDDSCSTGSGASDPGPFQMMRWPESFFWGEWKALLFSQMQSEISLRWDTVELVL